jgi:hypothetical protein
MRYFNLLSKDYLNKQQRKPNPQGLRNIGVFITADALLATVLVVWAQIWVQPFAQMWGSWWHAPKKDTTC